MQPSVAISHYFIARCSSSSNLALQPLRSPRKLDLGLGLRPVPAPAEPLDAACGGVDVGRVGEYVRREPDVGLLVDEDCGGFAE